MDEKMKNALAALNDKTRERYVDLVNEQGRNTYSHEEENAILRKVVFALVSDKVASDPSLMQQAPFAEFFSYHEFFENTKTRTKENLNIEEE